MEVHLQKLPNKVDCVRIILASQAAMPACQSARVVRMALFCVPLVGPPAWGAAAPAAAAEISMQISADMPLKERGAK